MVHAQVAMETKIGASKHRGPLLGIPITQQIQQQDEEEQLERYQQQQQQQQKQQQKRQQQQLQVAMKRAFQDVSMNWAAVSKRKLRMESSSFSSSCSCAAHGL